jgi:hypothetical protein
MHCNDPANIGWNGKVTRSEQGLFLYLDKDD